MREHKYRGWDKEHNRWASSAPTIIKRYCTQLPNVELMQYTGLKDKNGKEIYEGDIVRYSPADVCRRPAEVYWEEDGCQFRLATGGDRQFDKTRIIQFSKIGEVIGNIYESPHLLDNNSKL